MGGDLGNVGGAQNERSDQGGVDPLDRPCAFGSSASETQFHIQQCLCWNGGLWSLRVNAAEVLCKRCECMQGRGEGVTSHQASWVNKHMLPSLLPLLPPPPVPPPPAVTTDRHVCAGIDDRDGTWVRDLQHALCISGLAKRLMNK